MMVEWKSERRAGMTIVEALFGIALMTTLLAAIYIFLSGNIAQRRHLEGYVDLQRDARSAIIQIQRDLRGLITIGDFSRRPPSQLQRFEFKVPTDLDLTAPVSYEYLPSSFTLRRNGRDLITNTVVDVDLWLLDERERDVTDTAVEPYDDVHAIRMRLVIAEDGSGNDGSTTRQRTLDFTIHPRLPTSRLKSRQGRLNLIGGRFGTPDSRTAPRPGLGQPITPQDPGF